MSLLKSPTVGVRILALHGGGSNSDVTRLQLNNLGLSRPDYDIICANGPISVQEPGLGIEGLVTGSWCSWLPPRMNIDNLSREVLIESICQAVQNVLDIIENEGPFDAVYGFSQGGLIACLVNGLSQDDALLSALKARNGGVIPSAIQHGAPFKRALIACAACSLSLSQLRLRAGLGDSPVAPADVQSLHLIGREDDYKPWSESLALSLPSTSTKIAYLDSGHGINQLQGNDTATFELVQQCLQGYQDEFTAPTALEWQPSSHLSSRAIANDIQMAAVQLKTEGLPETIIEMLAAQPATAPLFRLAREQDANVVTSYGEMLAFCQPGGEGDLRRLGVHPDEVVAYLAPQGGSAVAAAAFLSIASQTCAVPFAANMSESDALMALEQYGVKHMVLFDSVVSGSVPAAFSRYADDGHARLHHADDSEVGSPGLFKYIDSIDDFESQPELSHLPASHSLLLRTSGTTSIPKVVPLRQKDLVLNGAILADSIGITASDITYSVMPLDHIGGLSASILCSVAVGASVTCDGLYNPQEMVEALASSYPQPTWYSAVPTIHNATVRYLHDRADTYLTEDGQWQGHNLRMIRSGAAALKESDRSLLEATFACETVTTYSMSELMPISQPPKQGHGWNQQTGSVGVPIAASMAIVDPITLRALPFGSEGEVAISGPTVFAGYMNNPDANRQSRFLLKSHEDDQFHTWFLTGDLGLMDRNGTLMLKGRIKELIKRGGEQVAPAEVEALLTQHSSVMTAVCFSVPSDIYGEEVGCALVLDPAFSRQMTQREIVREMKELLRSKGLAPYKSPSCWTVIASEDIPRTGNKKIIRNGLAEKLGVTSGVQAPVQSSAPRSEPSVATHQPEESLSGFDGAPVSGAISLSDKPKVDWATLAGFRFLLACYVMFMHIGSNESWDAFSNLRQFPWHVHTFFTLAGFSLVIFMPALITRKMSFISARISGMYPLYGLAVLIALGNLLVSCQPSTFSSFFQWAQIVESDSMFCQGTPLVQDSWFANLLLTLGIHLTGLQATPLWGASWFLGFYLWFISMYFQCLIIFPFIYNALYKNRGNTKSLLFFTVLGLGVNLLIVLSFWYGYAIDATGYGFFDALTGQRNTPDAAQMEAAGQDNAVILGFYLFAPFWMVYFIAGMCAAFLYDAIRPSEQQRAHLWGYVADTITLIMIAVSVGHVAQGYFPHAADMMSVSIEEYFMRPEAANSLTDPSTVNRIWDNIYGRLFAPLTLLWIFALSTGQGLTARALRFNPISQVLAPTAYACFLFHQMIGQWYYAATRHGEWWNWWSDQKAFYWFSPQPVPVEWYEYFYVVGLVVIFSKVIQSFEPAIRRVFSWPINFIKGVSVTEPAKDTTTEILHIVQRITGMEVKPEWNLEECGLASLGIVQFTNSLETEFSTSTHKVSLAVADIMAAQDIREIAAIVDAARGEVVVSSSPVQGGRLQAS